jgi:general secretion pathway protein A
MYQRFFGFRERPFDLTPNPRYLILTEAHREALSNLEYAISSRKGVTLLVGEAGAGKTTVIRAALEKQPTQVHCVHISNPALTREEFVEMLARRFDLSGAARVSKTAMLAELESLLVERRRNGETTVLIVDEGQSLSHELLEELRLLVNIETDDEKLLSLILAGQPELAHHRTTRHFDN